jgi:hypothetical protein
LDWLRDSIKNWPHSLFQWPRPDEGSKVSGGEPSGGNYVDMETGESFWVSGVKKNGEDRHWAGSGKVLVEAAALTEYLKIIGASTLEKSGYEVTDTIRQTDIERLARLANASGKGWSDDPEEAQNPYSFKRNVSSSRE